MEEKNYLVFVVVFSTAVVALLIVAVADLFLIVRNRRLRHRNEILEINSRFEQEILKTRHEATEQVFNEIASELHDNIGQTLTLAVIQLNKSERDPSQLSESVAEARDIVRQALQDVRQLSHDVSSDYWRNFDLEVSLRKMAERIGRSGQCDLALDIDTARLPSKDRELILLRVLQELISNTLKHAGAAKIVLNLREADGALAVTYHDNGKGYRESDKSSGMGLLMIRQRLELLSAQWSTESEPGKGFILQAAIPLHV